MSISVGSISEFGISDFSQISGGSSPVTVTETASSAEVSSRELIPTVNDGASATTVQGALVLYNRSTTEALTLVVSQSVTGTSVLLTTWPAVFPRPQRRSFSSATQHPFSETKFPASIKRRRKYEDPWTVYDIEMHFPLDVFPYFWSWYKYRALRGASKIYSFPVVGSNLSITYINGFFKSETLAWEFKETFWLLKFKFRSSEFTTPPPGEPGPDPEDPGDA